MQLPSVEQRAFHVYPHGLTVPVDATPTGSEMAAMNMCLELAGRALEAGDPPIGAVLVDNERDLRWGARTVDKSDPQLLGHAETRAYFEAKETVRDNLGRCSLVTTAEPCATCTAPFAEGNIGRIIYAVPRSVIREITGIMRARNINMLDLLADGDTSTTVIEGVQSEKAISLFGLYAQLRGYRTDAKT